MHRVILIGILLLAFLLRIINLANLPAGFTPDEASFGYDAYSLLQTGKDQWGYSWPLTFKSFGDYKLPVYTYLAIPSVYFLGLNEFAVRLPNAILGSFVVLFVYLVSFQLSKSKKLSLLAALMIAVSYWHVALSRGAFEANLTSFFMSGGIYFFLKARRDPGFLAFAMFFWGVNLFTYHSARLVTPIVVIAFLWFYRREFPKKKTYPVASFIFLLLFVVAIYSFIVSSGARASTSTIFSQNLGSGKLRASLVLSGLPLDSVRFIYNEWTFELSKFIGNYFSYFTHEFLLGTGAHEATYGMVPGIGVLTLVEFIGLGGFFIRFFRKREGSLMPFVAWILVAAVPAAISVGPGNAANRAAVFLPALQILASFGILYLIPKNKHQFKTYMIVFALAFVLGCINIARYTIEQPVNASSSMMYGMKATFEELKKHPGKYVVLSNKLSEPHIYAMFYGNISPEMSQLASRKWNIEERDVYWVDQIGTYYIGKYTFTEPQKTRYLDGTVVVARAGEVPEGVKVIKTILTPDNQPIIVLSEKR